MIDRGKHDLPISRQAEALGVSRRRRLPRKPRPTSAEDFTRTLRRLDELHLGYPFCGQAGCRATSSNREGVSIYGE